MKTSLLRNIPSIDKLLKNEKIISLINKYDRNIVLEICKSEINKMRKNILSDSIYTEQDLLTDIENHVKSIFSSKLKPMINATGILLHTNLGRAPLGEKILNDISEIILNYSNLEFDLETGKRGHRDNLIKDIMNTITNAEDSIVVNNNAGAVHLVLKALAEGKEVIVSRGELIEIGGSFRIPDIMKTSGAKMVEVGATNKTKISDYENAITENTAIIFKAHKSNYSIVGFTEEASLMELSNLAKKHNLILYYDLGSGLLKKPKGLSQLDEPDVKSALFEGADIVSFSTDKLLGGPQSGIICGKKNLIQVLSTHPLMRVLRVGKLTYSSLISVIRMYLNEEELIKNNFVFSRLSLSENELYQLAIELSEALQKKDIPHSIEKSYAKTGGGTLPTYNINSFSIKLFSNEKKNDVFAGKIFYELLKSQKPILTILKDGYIFLDIIALKRSDFNQIAESISNIVSSLKKKGL